MQNLVDEDFQIPEGGTTEAEASLYADQQRQLKLLYQQRHPGLMHLLAVIQFRRDDASRVALAPGASTHESGQGFAMQELLKHTHAMLFGPVK